ncbi:MAG: hypothetical protein SGJ02_07025 [bacterium]|nr:hypothetical protein [bacterium]
MNLIKPIKNNRFKILAKLWGQSNFLSRFFLQVVFLIPNLGYADDQTLNNTSQESTISSVRYTERTEKMHYVKRSSVEFGSWETSLDSNRKRVNSEEVRARLEKYREIQKSAISKFVTIPELPRCDRSATKIKKDQMRWKEEQNFQIDILYYDALSAQERSTAEMWVGRKVAYDSENIESGMRFGNLLGIRCLPTRIVLTKKGLELREGESAWKMNSKDKEKPGKAFEKEIQQVRKSYR